MSEVQKVAPRLGRVESSFAVPTARALAPPLGDAIGVAGRESAGELLPPLPNALEQQELIDFLAREIAALRDRLEQLAENIRQSEGWAS